MCLLSLFPGGTLPAEEHIRNGAEMNPHGFGWAIVTKDMDLLTGRSMSADKAISDFLAIRGLHPDGPALFHSRLSTGGLRTEQNCHPFQAGRDRRTVIAHNGTLFTAKGYRSDTREFAEDIFPDKYSRLDDGDTVRDLLEFVRWNKLVILTVNPRYKHTSYLVNGLLGHWVDEKGTEYESAGEGLAWHSNRDYRTPLTYRHELPLKYGWSKVVYTDRTQDDCTICGAKYAVNRVTDFCQVCLACQGCERKLADGCTCYGG